MTKSESEPRTSKKARFARAVVKRVLFLVGVELLLFGCSTTIADRLLLFPTRHALPAGGDRQLLDVDGHEIELFVSSHGDAAEPEFVICAFTGNAGRAEYQVESTRQLFAGAFPTRTFEVVAMQWPGYGESGGGASLESFATCAKAAFEHARMRAGERPLIVHAVSIGTTAGLHVTAGLENTESAPLALLLEKPPSLISQIYSHGWWNLWLLALPVASGVPATARSVELAAQVEAPAVFVIADTDQVVPARYSREVRQAYAGESRLVEMRGGHNDPVTRSRAPERDEAMGWLLGMVGL